MFGGVDRRAGAVKRHVGIGPQPVIGDRLDVVGLGQELAQLKTEPGLVSRQSGKLGVHALVGFRVFARALRDQRLRRVKGSEVGIAAGVFAYPGGKAWFARGPSTDGPCRNALSLQASQIDALTANFPH